MSAASKSDLTPPEHERTEAVTLAAQWLADELQPPQPIIPILRQRFDLTAMEAIEAAALANRYRICRVAHG
ncbi:hypothetical protein [Rhizobium rhizogenes]|uniref:Uncharacterized protein n=1 Tax=Rhizobium rhizogenes (strain K84 / ATCC BAA-868) TaxID=311403 RepID=B9J9D0_RHIR8|nr:hypothetical protein Arad_3626 [Rhizobium rhizogenes K84]